MDFETTNRLRQVTLSVNDCEYHFPVAVDDGADFSIVGSDSAIKFSRFYLSCRPFSFKVADNRQFQCDTYVLFDVTVSTVCGPVTVRRHPIYVAKFDMPAVLLGRPFPKP